MILALSLAESFEPLCLRIKQAESVVGCDPQSAFSIDEKSTHGIVAETGGIGRTVSIGLEAAGPPVETIEPSAERSEPHITHRIFDDRDDVVVGKAAGMPVTPVERKVSCSPVNPVQGSFIRYPEKTFPVLVYGGYRIRIQAVWIAAFVTVAVKRNRPGRRPVQAASLCAHP